MSDTSTDDLRTSDDVEGPDDGELHDDGPVEAPVVGCTRCEARVPLGSRYCPICGTPLVRSGEQAATALSRTRRRAPILVRLLVPLIFLGVLAAIWYVAHLDVFDDSEVSPGDRLARVVAGHRTLSDRLEDLEGESNLQPAERAARDALATVRDVQDETEGTESGQTGQTTRIRAALSVDRLYLSAVVRVLADPRSPLLNQLGSRSAKAVAALREVDDISNTTDAIRGTKLLGDAIRARRSGGTGASSGGATTTAAKPKATSSPFVTAVERVITSGARVRPRTARGFALLRAARDGVGTWDGQGAAPASPQAAVAEARQVFGVVAARRSASAGRAREIPTTLEKQRAITDKLASAYAAGATTATRIESCIGSFQNSGPATVARQCLLNAREPGRTESAAVRTFSTSYAPAREAAGLAGGVPKL